MADTPGRTVAAGFTVFVAVGIALVSAAGRVGVALRGVRVGVAAATWLLSPV